MSMSDISRVMTPMQRQYNEIKSQNKGSLLFFRLGDFYELFYEDAELVSKELNLTLTSRHKKSEYEMPMCGIPYHSASKYLARLTKKGYRIAICEQISDPKLPGIVKREVVKIITPGTTFQDEALEARENNYLLSISERQNMFGVCYTDLSTGEIYATCINDYNSLKNEVFRIKPSEVILPKTLFSGAELKQFLTEELNISVNIHNGADHYQTIKTHFKVKNLEGYGIEEDTIIIEAVGNLISYIKQTQKNEVSHINILHRYTDSEFMVLDKQAIRNLELLFTLYDGERKGSLLWVLDQTKTAVGGRLLRKILLEPLQDKNKIQDRLNAVEEIIETPSIIEKLDILKNTYDIERIMAKLNCNYSSARDLVALKQTLSVLPGIATVVKSCKTTYIQKILEVFENPVLKNIYDKLDTALKEDPPLTIREGKIIKDGYNKELDELRKLMNGGKEWLARYQEEEKKRTGINTLKIGFNKVFGYYIEITKSQVANAPDDYIRKQTLTNGERFISPILKEYEQKILTAEEKIVELEYNLYQDLVTDINSYTVLLQQVSKSIAVLDLITSFAVIALNNNYVKPEIVDDNSLVIRDGRHPVVERIISSDEQFVPNDIALDTNKVSEILLTGPNMAGKSTYLRQTALIVLLAHIGCYVPARSARVPITDRIFTRVGASDNLTKGQSTFMVEMQETTNILNNATDRSLLILDEIGRGTSTYDGLSLAWSIFEYIHDKIQAKMLFATHYHEMIDLANNLKRSENYSMAVNESADGVIFLRKVKQGGADDSYGIEVAKLAGLPDKVIERASEVLEELEKNSRKKEGMREANQLSFISPTVVEKIVYKEANNDAIIKDLEGLHIDKITPMEALIKLHDWKKRYQKKGFT